MTNIEIKLELAKAALSNPNNERVRLQDMYEWITEEEPFEVTEPKTDYDTKSISELLNHINKNDNNKYNGGSVGYMSRLSKIFRSNNINTVGDLLKIERRWFSRYRNVGNSCIKQVDDALKELYGITAW